MRKYFIYELKKSAFIIACLSVIAIVIYLSPLLTVLDATLFRNNYTYLAFPSFIGGVLAVCVPVWAFHYKMKKRSVDMFYSLPLSHTKVLAVKYLIGLLAVLLPYTISYWLGAFVVMGRAASTTLMISFYPAYYPAHYFATIIPIFFLYAISSFFYTRANSLLDGVLFIIFWICLAALIAFVMYQIVDIQKIPISPYYYFPFAPLDYITTYFSEKIIIPKYYSSYYNSRAYNNMAVGFSLTTILAIASSVGIFLTERRAKAEDSEQISNSWFGYRVMIPLYTVCMMAWMDISSTDSLIFYAMIVAGSFLITALYKRSMKIGKIQAIVYFSAIVVGIFLSFLFWNIL